MFAIFSAQQQFRAIFPEADDQLLNYLDDDGMSIEPSWYIPVVPVALMNGCDGIGECLFEGLKVVNNLKPS